MTTGPDNKQSQSDEKLLAALQAKPVAFSGKWTLPKRDIIYAVEWRSNSETPHIDYVRISKDDQVYVHRGELKRGSNAATHPSHNFQQAPLFDGEKLNTNAYSLAVGLSGGNIDIKGARELNKAEAALLGYRTKPSTRVKPAVVTGDGTQAL